MFDRPESLIDDIDQLAETRQFPSPGSALSSSEVGQSIIMLALGRVPSTYIGLAAEDKVSDLRQQTARQLIARWFLAREASLYASLGVAPDCSHEILRENYRRLMGLVHPDTRPVGFPEDSASRVNMAYSVLADAERRASYDASIALLTQQSPPASQQTTTVAARARTSQQDAFFDRFRSALPHVRFGHGLLVIAGLMLLPIGYAVYSLTSRDIKPQIVEAGSKLNVSPNFVSRSERPTNSAVVATQTVADSSTAVANAAPQPNKLRGVVAGNQPATALDLPPKLALSSRLQNLIGGAPLVAPTPTESPRIQNNAPAPAPARSSTDTGNGTVPQQETVIAARPGAAPPASTTSAGGGPERAATKLQPSQEASQQVSAPDRALRASTASPTPAQPVSAATPPLAESRVNPADADDVLVRLSGAYEAGSIAAFNKVFATSMAGRRQLLSDYERVFQQTRQRSIRFTQFKHKVSGEKLFTSGFAVVSTVDNENRASSQRIFLEIDIGRDTDGLKIERLHNYPLN